MTNLDNYRFDVFISYSHKDKEWVRGWLLSRLKQARFRVSIDFETFSIGAPLVKNIESSIVESRKTLLVLTPSYLQSEWAEFENFLVQTLDPSARARRTIPLLLEHSNLPPRLKFLTYLDFTKQHEREELIPRLAQALRSDDETETIQVPTAIHHLSSKETVQRIQAAKRLGTSSDNSTIPALSRQLRLEADPEARYWIALAIAEIGGEEAKHILKSFAHEIGENPDPFTRLTISDALSLMDQNKK